MAMPKRLRTRRATASAKPASALDAQVWVFDVEGTLVDAVMPTLRCWRGTLEMFGHDANLAELHRLSGMDGKEMLAKLLPRVSATEREEMLNRQGARYREDFLADVPAFLEVRMLFETLKRRECSIALATDCGKDELGHYLEITGIEDLVDAIACGDDVRKGKPAASIVELALRRVKAARKPAVMVGDTPFDAKAARKAGIASIGLLTGHFAARDLFEAGCAAVFRDPAALLDAISDDAGTATGEKPAATAAAVI